MAPLAGRICLVAGASRGVGLGAARGLGEAGATVIVAARSSEAGRRTEGRPETIEEAARLVDSAGGRGVHYVCDLTNEREVDQLASWALRRFGRIDLLVGCAWGGAEKFDGARFPDGSGWGDAAWRRPPALLGTMLETALLAQLLIARAIAPAMVAAKKGLMIFITADDESRYLGDPFFDLAKQAAARLAFVVNADLQNSGATALALAPRPTLTERARDAGFDDAALADPLEAGRAIAALAADPQIARHGGRLLRVSDLINSRTLAREDAARPAAIHAKGP